MVLLDAGAEAVGRAFVRKPQIVFNKICCYAFASSLAHWRGGLAATVATRLTKRKKSPSVTAIRPERMQLLIKSINRPYVVAVVVGGGYGVVVVLVVAVRFAFDRAHTCAIDNSSSCSSTRRRFGLAGIATRNIMMRIVHKHTRARARPKASIIFCG